MSVYWPIIDLYVHEQVCCLNTGLTTCVDKTLFCSDLNLKTQHVYELNNKLRAATH